MVNKVERRGVIVYVTFVVTVYVILYFYKYKYLTCNLVDILFNPTVSTCLKLSLSNLRNGGHCLNNCKKIYILVTFSNFKTWVNVVTSQ